MTSNHNIQWNTGRAIIGIILIFIGLVYLGISLGLFDWSLWLQIWRLWPILFIAIGLSVLLRQSFSRFAAIVLFAVVLGLGFWFLWQKSEFQKSGAVSYRNVQERLIDGAKSGKLDVSLSSATVRLSGPADTNTFTSGKVETKGSEHVWDTRLEGSTQVSEVDQFERTLPFVGTQGFAELQLTQNLPLDIELTSGRLDANLDLTSLVVERLVIESGASTINCQFGDKSAKTEVRIHAGASSLIFSAPKSVGVQITTESAVSAIADGEFEKTEDGAYVTPGFADAEKKIIIDIQSGVASIDFTRV